MIAELEHPLMNGAGCIKTFEGVEAMARSAVSAVVLGSITWDRRDGNAGNTFTYEGFFALNALGLPNPGHVYYHDHLAAMKAACDRNGKPLVVSLAGFSEQEYHALAHLCADQAIENVELNFGCPNAQEDHPIWSFDPDAMRRVIIDVASLIRNVGVKLSPFSNPSDLFNAAQIIPGQVEYVATSNTFPNADARHAPRQPLSPEYAGMSGDALRPIALGQVAQLRELLDSRVAIVGVGGIISKPRIDDYLAAGADAVQAVTAYWAAGEDPMVFSDILMKGV